MPTDPTGGIFLEQNGLLTHMPSEMKFPARLDGFERRPRPAIYDRQGYRAEIAYWRETWFFGRRRTVLRVHVYPSALTADGARPQVEVEFEAVAAGLRQKWPQTRMLDEGRIEVRDGEGVVAGRRGRFLAVTPSGALVMDVHLFRRGLWSLRHEFHYLKAPRAAVPAAEIAVMNALGPPPHNQGRAAGGMYRPS